jgi:hypothetical protein
MRVRDINGSKKKTRIMAANSAGGYAEGERGRNSHHTHEKIPTKKIWRQYRDKKTRQKEYISKKNDEI